MRAYRSGLTGCNYLLGTSSAETADFVCSMDRAAISGYFTLTITNPGSSVIIAATVQVNFCDASEDLIDTKTSDVGTRSHPGGRPYSTIRKRNRPHQAPAKK
jgi:hypothetical protein